MEMLIGVTQYFAVLIGFLMAIVAAATVVVLIVDGNFRKVCFNSLKKNHKTLKLLKEIRENHSDEIMTGQLYLKKRSHLQQIETIVEENIENKIIKFILGEYKEDLKMIKEALKNIDENIELNEDKKELLEEVVKLYNKFANEIEEFDSAEKAIKEQMAKMKMKTWTELVRNKNNQTPGNKIKKLKEQAY